MGKNANGEESITCDEKRHRERAGLPEMRFHGLRDTAGPLMIRGGVDARTMADILGHANLTEVCARLARHEEKGRQRDRFLRPLMRVFKLKLAPRTT